MLVHEQFYSQVGGQIRQDTPGAWGGLHTGSIAQKTNPRASPESKIHQKSIKNPSKKSEFFGPKIEKIENFGTDLGWFGGAFGTVWGYFRDGFGPTLKSRKIESSELKN